MGADTATDPCISRGTSGRAALLLVSAGDLLLRDADDTLAASGLDSRDYSILSILAADEPGTQQELARLLHKAPAIVVAAIDDLEARGLVRRTRDPVDRRRSRVTLTKAGAAALTRADRLADTAFDRLFAGLDAGELRELRDLLARGLQPLMAATSPAAP